MFVSGPSHPAVIPWDPGRFKGFHLHASLDGQFSCDNNCSVYTIDNVYIYICIYNIYININIYIIYAFIVSIYISHIIYNRNIVLLRMDINGYEHLLEGNTFNLSCGPLVSNFHFRLWRSVWPSPKPHPSHPTHPSQRLPGSCHTSA